LLGASGLQTLDPDTLEIRSLPGYPEQQSGFVYRHGCVWLRPHLVSLNGKIEAPDGTSTPHSDRALRGARYLFPYRDGALLIGGLGTNTARFMRRLDAVATQPDADAVE
jgi:hypothetical protein